MGHFTCLKTIVLLAHIEVERARPLYYDVLLVTSQIGFLTHKELLIY